MGKDFAKLKNSEKKKYHKKYLDKGLVKFRRGDVYNTRVSLFSWFR